MIHVHTIRTSYPLGSSPETKGKIFDSIVDYCHGDLLHLGLPMSVKNTVIKIKTGSRIDLGRLTDRLDEEFGGWNGGRKAVLSVSSYVVREIGDGLV